MMSKTIFFILDSFELYPSIYNKIPKKTLCYSYFDTEEAINNNMPHIVTYDIGHLSFDLEELGYSIFIGYNGHSKQFYSGMSIANGKELRKTHNLRRLLISGVFDEILGKPRKIHFKSVNQIFNDNDALNEISDMWRDEFMKNYLAGYDYALKL